MIPDDFIGETIIDLEDRFFSKKFMSLKHVPIETRDLKHPSSALSRGTIRLWVDVIPRVQIDRLNNIYCIEDKPEKEFELRVVVWGC